MSQDIGMARTCDVPVRAISSLVSRLSGRWKICADHGWWSVFGKKTRKRGKVGTPAHDDLVRRDFTAPAPNQLWLTDLTEHRTSEGKLYLCVIKGVRSNRIVGYSISDRMESQITVDALESAMARRSGDFAGCRQRPRPPALDHP
jgi:transposase InsO family protein